MAVITFHQPVDMEAFDVFDWIGETPTVHTRNTMVFESDDEVVTLGGTNFTYVPFVHVPLDGLIQTVSITEAGLPELTMSGLSVDISDLYANADDPEAIAHMFFDGDDRITGSSGIDGLFGFDGADNINGRGGADAIHGGFGKDVLKGGGGADVFTFLEIADSGLTGSDVIRDLGRVDFIDLTQLDVQGDITATYRAAADRTTFSIDVNGDGAADMRIIALGDQTGFDNFLT